MVLEAVGGCLQAMVHVDGPHLAGQEARPGALRGDGERPSELARIEHEINYNNDYSHMKWPDLFGFIAEKLKAGP